MESYVTRREFENVLKEVRRLQYFLADTFGPKFMEFFKDDKFAEVESRLKNELGSFTTNVLNATLNVVPPPLSRSSSSGGEEMPVEKENINEVLLPPPPALSPPTGVPVATSARLILDKAHAREIYAQKIVRNVDAEDIFSNSRPSDSFTSAASASVVPISVVRSFKRKLPPGEDHEEAAPSTSQIGKRSSAVTNDDVKVECVDLDDEDDDKSKTSRIELESEPTSLQPVAYLPQMPPTAPLPSFRRSKFLSKLKKPDSGDIIQCPKCHLYIYSSQMDEHLKTHSILNGNGKKPTEKSSLLSTPSTKLLFKHALTCFLCKTEFSTFQFYEGHCNLRHRDGNPCPICLKVLHPNAKLRKHMEAHENPKFVCQVCGMCCQRADNLEYHVKLHHEGRTGAPKDFYCMYCDAHFLSWRSRDQHQKKTHAFHHNQDEATAKQAQAPPESPPPQTHSTTRMMGSEIGAVGGDLHEVDLDQDQDNDGGSAIIGAGELIDVSAQIKVDTTSTFQFEYEGDEDDDELF